MLISSASHSYVFVTFWLVLIYMIPALLYFYSYFCYKNQAILRIPECCFTQITSTAACCCGWMNAELVNISMYCNQWCSGAGMHIFGQERHSCNQGGTLLLRRSGKYLPHYQILPVLKLNCVMQNCTPQCKCIRSWAELEKEGLPLSYHDHQ